MLAIRVKGLGHQLLGQPGAVIVGGVDERDTSLDGRPQHGHGVLSLPARPPVSGAGQLGGAIAETAYGQLTAEQEDIIERG
ncbi:hypothetical protein GCM10010207_19030 [Streptomyces atratus]|nr:hypothetical protein GCM10010207_19030 [Streptomyces atratus]